MLRAHLGPNGHFGHSSAQEPLGRRLPSQGSQGKGLEGLRAEREGLAGQSQEAGTPALCKDPPTAPAPCIPPFKG